MTEATTTQFDQPSSLILLIIHHPFSSTVTLAMRWERWSLENIKAQRTFYVAIPMIDD